MKRFSKIFVSLLCAAVIAMPVFLSACDTQNDNPPSEKEVIDYAGQLKLDMTSETKKQEVTVKLFVDGDTTHFDPVSNSSEFSKTQG